MRNLFAVLLLISSLGFGQSSYHRLGYGALFQNADPFVASLGTGVIALHDTTRATFWNPASLNNLKRVYFSGVVGSDFISTDLALTNKTRFLQVMVGLPLGENVGLSLSLRPVANFNSRFQATQDTGLLTELSSGGIWDYSLGLGAKVKPDLEVGLKYHLLHGIFRRELQLNSDLLAEEYVLKGDISGASIELGAIASLGDKVRLGLTANLTSDTPLLSGEDSLAGTSNFNSFEETLGAWPTTIKLGVVYRKSPKTSYLAGISQQIFPADGFSESKLFAPPEGWVVVPVGSFQASVIRYPTERSSRNWYRRLGWQTGFAFKNHYLSSSTDNLIYELSWNSGLNLSLRNGRGVFDLSAELGTRSGEESLPAETFGRLKFGIQVNDIWFKKAKRR